MSHDANSSSVRIVGLTTHGTYGTGRVVAELSAILGWLVVVAGVCAAVAGFAAPQPFNLVIAVMGVGIASLGVLQVAAGQAVRASLDSADYSRQALILQAALAEGRSEVNLGEPYAVSSAGHRTSGPPPLSAGPRIVEEGVYKGRKWVRYENGTIAAELMGGRFKEFGSVEEFQRYIA